MIACNNDGVWNTTGATVAFTIAAAWYQTTWFRALSVLLVILLIWAVYQLRLRQVARNLAARFDDRLEERTRIARELHDTLLQTIQASKMVADDALTEPADLARIKPGIQRLGDWLGRAVEEGRAAVNALRTSATEENDPARALRLAAEHCDTSDATQVSVTVIGSPREMHPIVRDEIYRIGYEAIRNACAHSQSPHVEIELRYDKDVFLRIEDQGVGIPANVLERGKPGHFGVIGMRERAARIGAAFTLNSSTKGTEITLTIPGSRLFVKRE